MLVTKANIYEGWLPPKWDVVLLFYYDLSDSTIIGVMSSLFGIVNSIRPFCIFLCIYTFYYVLYSAILTYDILDFCGDVLLFLLGSVKFCKLLCNSTFYALMYVIIQDGLLSEFLYSVLRPSIMICFSLWSCIMLTSYPAWHSVGKN